MTTFRAEAATDPLYNLAEGVIWDDRHDLVRWVDILRGDVVAGTLGHGRITVTESVRLGQTAGAVAPAQDGGVLVAAARGLATISPGGAVSVGPDLLGDRVGVRFNDATVDMFGAVIVGTLTMGDETGEELLLRIQPDGAVETVRAGIRLSNGIAFAPDGATVYHVDTLAYTVSTHSYGPGPFDSEEPWQPIALDLPHYPDGLAIDSEGALWIAQWGGSSVRRHAPTGELLDIVMVDAEQASCPGFVGRDLDLLAITSAQEGLGSVNDQAGAIFLADVGVTGVPIHRWAANTTTPYWLRPERDDG